MTKHDVLAALHELVGHCGHCGKRSCPGRDSHSTLPGNLSTADVLRALTIANRAVKKRRECRELDKDRSNKKTATLEMGTSSEPGAGAEPGASRPAAAPADQPAAPAPGELCDIDDLPDCMVGGVHQEHCRHAGRPVTSGGNP